jgi:hypothetical protein
MAVVSCNVDDVSIDEDLNGYSTYSVVYRVITDTATGPETVRVYAGLPNRNSTYSVSEGTVIESNTGATYQGKSVKFQEVKESRKVFLVTSKFSDNPNAGQKTDPEEPPALPWEAPADISTHSQKDKKPILLDLDGNLIASSAGEPYDPVQEVDDTHYLLRIVKNFLNIDIPFNASYRDAAVSRIPSRWKRLGYSSGYGSAQQNTSASLGSSLSSRERTSAPPVRLSQSSTIGD